MDHQDEESQPLTAPGVRPVPLRFAHLWKAAKTYIDAFEFDPLILYFRAGEKPRPRTTRIAQNLVVLGLWSIKEISLTLNGGTALMIAFPNLFGPKTPFERLIDSLAFRISDSETPNRTEEQEKRFKEGNEKSHAALEIIHDRLPQMIFFGLICTDPASQGHGYGTALIEAMNDIADERGQAMWLTSSNVLNDTFYNSHGFETVATYYMGEGNPEWHQKPVPVQIMVREPKNKRESPPMKGTSKVFNVDPLFPLRILI
ncbi:hypothetical protein BJ912DRAFT_9827 [Pholiota molesta]|nr:hypothetical protein BJ912DRAFT_9827 [Pholiota molesta]